MPHPTDIEVGRKVREARILRGFTQTQLGDRLGISFQQVQKYEKGTNRIGASRLWHMRQVLDVPIDFFFAEIEDPAGSNGETIARQSLQLAKELDLIADTEAKSSFLTLLRLYNAQPDANAVRTAAE